MKHDLNERMEERQSLGHHRIAIEDYYSWGANEAILEEWRKYLEAARPGCRAVETRRQAS